MTQACHQSPHPRTNLRTLMTPHVFLGGITLSLIAMVDRISKIISLTSWTQPTNVTSNLSFVQVYNKGICWGIFNKEQSFLFAFLLTTCIVSVVMALCYHMILQQRAGISIIGEWLVLLGALSNLFDRFYYGAVIDFIHLFYRNYSFPIFNIADCCILCGACIIIITHHKTQKTAPGTVL
jgi:signal peptidase II